MGVEPIRRCCAYFHVGSALLRGVVLTLIMRCRFKTRSSVSPYVQASFEASLIPAIDSIRSLGIVWIPGLMAGMLLSGAKPVYAAIYQFVVLAMIFTASGLTALASTVLIRGRVFSPAEQLLLQPGR